MSPQPPTLELVSRLEGECEEAVARVVEAAARHLDHPGPSTPHALTAYREQLVNQCDRLCALLLRLPDHRRYRARYHADFGRFLAKWPDLFADPADFPSLRAILQAWDAPEVDPAPSSASRRRAVHELLLKLFTADELRRWLGHHAVLEPLRQELPTDVSVSRIVDDLVAAAERRGLLGPPFFDALEQDRPGRADDIAGVRALW